MHRTQLNCTWENWQSLYTQVFINYYDCFGKIRKNHVFNKNVKISLTSASATLPEMDQNWPMKVSNGIKIIRELFLKSFWTIYLYFFSLFFHKMMKSKYKQGLKSFFFLYWDDWVNNVWLSCTWNRCVSSASRKHDSSSKCIIIVSVRVTYICITLNSKPN